MLDTSAIEHPKLMTPIQRNSTVYRMAFDSIKSVSAYDKLLRNKPISRNMIGTGVPVRNANTDPAAKNALY